MVYALNAYESSLKLDYRAITGWSCLLLGRIYGNYKADSEKAEKYLGLGEEMFTSIDHTEGAARIRLDRADQRVNRYETDLAIHGFRRALMEFRSIGREREQGYCLYALAEAMYDKKMFDSARGLAEQSLAVRRTLDNSYQHDIGFSLSLLGLIAEACDSLTVAESYYYQADSLFRSIDHAAGIRLNAVRLGAYMLDVGNSEKARYWFELSEGYQDRFEEKIGTQFGLAICDYLDGKFDNSLSRLRHCIRLHERSAMKLPVPQARKGMLSDRIGFYNLAATIFAERYLSENIPDYIDSTFHYIERSRAQVLRDMVAFDPDPSEQAKVEPLLDQIAQLDNSLMLGEGDSTELQSAIYQLEDSLQKVRFRLGRGPIVGSRGSKCGVVDIKTVQKSLLNNGEILIQYLISEFGCFLLTVTGDSRALEAVPVEWEKLKDDVDNLLTHLLEYPVAKKPSREFYDLSRRLCRLLIPDRLFQEADSSRFIVMPDGPLYSLPFDVLMDDERHYLIEKHALSYTTSMTVLSSTISRRMRYRDKDGIVIFANPATDSSIASLTGSESEVEVISNAFPSAAVAGYTGLLADKKRFREIDYSRTRILHLATHGFINRFQPERSALLFAGDGRRRGSLLQADEIAGMNLPVDLVVLSACGTVSGVSLPGEGVMNLAKPFIIAGAGTVIAADWMVDDRAATVFVREFYSRLAGDDDKLGALTRTKRRFLSSEVQLYRHPYFWAGWRLAGSNR